MKTIELNSQQIDFLLEVLKEYETEKYSQSSEVIARQIRIKLNEE